MQDYSNLGQVFHDFRTNRKISLKQVACEDISVSQISRFERGESDISASRFFRALDNMKVEINEFMGVLKESNHSDTIDFMRKLVPLEYKRDVEGFKVLFDEQAELYRKNPSVYQYHLNMILAKGFICKCDETEPFPKEYMDEIADYLFTTQEWNMYEIILIGNLYLFMDIPLLHKMGQEVFKNYGKNGVSKPVSRITLLNIYETCLHRDALKVARFYKEEIPKLIADETLLYERNIYYFLTGLYDYKSGDVSNGRLKMEQSIKIYEWLGCDNLAKNYKKDMEKYT